MKVGVTQNNLEVNQAGWHITELLKLDKMIGISTLMYKHDTRNREKKKVQKKYRKWKY